MEGVSQSRCFLIYLTKNYFHHMFTILEFEAALYLEKKKFIVWESDERYGGYSNWTSYMKNCPAKYQPLFFVKEAVMFERHKHLQVAQINIIVDRIMRYPKLVIRDPRSNNLSTSFRGAKSKFTRYQVC